MSLLPPGGLREYNPGVKRGAKRPVRYLQTDYTEANLSLFIATPGGSYEPPKCVFWGPLPQAGFLQRCISSRSAVFLQSRIAFRRAVLLLGRQRMTRAPCGAVHAPAEQCMSRAAGRRRSSCGPEGGLCQACCRVCQLCCTVVYGKVNWGRIFFGRRVPPRVRVRSSDYAKNRAQKAGGP